MPEYFVSDFCEKEYVAYPSATVTPTMSPVGSSVGTTDETNWVNSLRSWTSLVLVFGSYRLRDDRDVSTCTLESQTDGRHDAVRDDSAHISLHCRMSSQRSLLLRLSQRLPSPSSHFISTAISASTVGTLMLVRI